MTSDTDDGGRMRKLITTTFMTLDGVVHAPGGPEKDPSKRFASGGWAFPDWCDEADPDPVGRAGDRRDAHPHVPLDRRLREAPLRRGAVPTAFAVARTTVASNGVIMSIYRPGGSVTTGSFGGDGQSPRRCAMSTRIADKRSGATRMMLCATSTSWTVHEGSSRSRANCSVNGLPSHPVCQSA